MLTRLIPAGMSAAEFRALRRRFTPQALALADALRSGGIATTEGYLRREVPLPGWFHAALGGAALDLGSPYDWPEWGRCYADVDWFTLVENHPGELVIETGPEDASWDGIRTAATLLTGHGHTWFLDMWLSVTTTGALGAAPVLLVCRTDHIDAALSARVADILSAAGRPRRLLNRSGEPWWQVGL